MNPDLLPAIGQALRDIAARSALADITDATLTVLAADLDRARRLVLQAQGHRVPTPRCERHPGGPVDPTAEGGCLLCDTAVRRPAPPAPESVGLGEVWAAVADRGHEAATAQYGARAVARALATAGRYPSTSRPGDTADPHAPNTEGEAL